MVLFQPNSLSVGPFPSNALTKPDNTLKTGVRVNLPSSAESCYPYSGTAVCSNFALLNQLDGFSVNPRLMVCFSAPVDTSTLQSGIEIVGVSTGSAVGINQLIYDPDTNCAFAKPNHVLNQDSAYLLVVLNSVRDAQESNVGADPRFETCLAGSDPYCQALNKALIQVDSRSKAVAASLFTTMSATTWLEEAWQYVDAVESGVVLPAGSSTSFTISNLQRITWNPQQSGLGPQTIPLTALGGVGRIVFGLYPSPVFLNVAGPAAGTISVLPTKLPIAPPTTIALVSFHVFLPAGVPPTGGFPIAIYGHGLGDNQFGGPTFITSTLAKKGYATLAIEFIGHGYGPGSTVNLTDQSGFVHTVATPGRGVLLPGNTEIGPTDGCIALGSLAIGIRDCARQTAVDLFALVQTIRKSDGLGLPLNPGRIYYIGQSFGSTAGTLFHAVEPNVRTGVLNGAGGTSVDVARLSISGRPLSIAYLASVNPALLNVMNPSGPDFNDNYVFRDMPPVTNDVPGAMTIQAAFEAADWLGMLGDPLSYAPHLQVSPLPGVPVKSTLFQFGLGDLEVPNPTESAVIRAANAQQSSSYFLFNQAAAIAPDLVTLTYDDVGFPILPHRILSNPTVFECPDETPLSMAEQQQVAAYFSADGESIPNPNSFLTESKYSDVLPLFVTPQPLPEQLNYFQFH
ncbi:MAG: hypothetical protein JO138_27860 [Acidobacteriaceae bacterium]|nr:hypothetical protein [Acidobacteriaceae bacterium]